MIPHNFPNIRAVFYERDRDDDDKLIGTGRYYTLPVIAWDRDGNAMVPSISGRLATAVGHAVGRSENEAAKTAFLRLEDDEQDRS